MTFDLSKAKEALENMRYSNDPGFWGNDVFSLLESAIAEIEWQEKQLYRYGDEIAEGLIKNARLRDELAALRAELERKDKALDFIIAWRLPQVVSRIDGKLSSYGLEYGSNGERDYMRDIARAARTEAQRNE